MGKRAIYHLNQANDEWEDNEKRTIKIETGTSTANQDVNSTSQSANEGEIPRRSKRLEIIMHDQAMTSQENSAIARSDEWIAVQWGEERERKILKKICTREQ